MLNRTLLAAAVGLLWMTAPGQDSRIIKREITREELIKLKSMYGDGVLTKIDTLYPNQSFTAKIKEAIGYTEKYISSQIGEDIFRSNYKIDDSFNTVFWISRENDVLISNSNNIQDGDLKDITGFPRFIISYSLSYVNIQSPVRGFSIYIQLSGNKSTINVQLLAKLTREKNLTNILTREEFLAKLKKMKLKREVKKYIKKNITINQVAFDHINDKEGIFNQLYYSIPLKGIREPATYMFDPWTGELCCIQRTTFH